MLQFVRTEICLLGETFTAEAAHKRLMARVQQQVRVEVGHLGEGLPADGTRPVLKRWSWQVVVRGEFGE